MCPTNGDLDGGPGADTLPCENGGCSLTGNGGCDTFVIKPTTLGPVVITDLQPGDIIELMTTDPECMEAIGGWEVMHYTEPGAYTVELTPDGQATICWMEDDSYCEEFDICPEVDPWWMLDDDSWGFEDTEEQLHWFGGWGNLGRNYS